MKRSIFLALLLLAAWPLHAQRERIDSLLLASRKPAHDTIRQGIYYLLAKEYVHIDVDSSIRFAQKSLSLAGSNASRRLEADCYGILGVNEKNRGHFEQALQYQLRALRIKEALQDIRGLASTYNDIGILYKIMGRIDEALAHYRRSNELCIRAGIGKGIAMTYNNIGTIHREKKNGDSALHYYQLGLQQAERIGDAHSIATCLSNVGDMYSEQGRDAEALAMFTRCLRYDRANEDKPGMVVSYNNVARALAALKRFSEAVRYSDSAIALGLAEQLHQERINTYSIRVLIEEWSGNPANALAFYRKLMNLKDSILNIETSGKIRELEARYETEKKEQQIAMQQLQLNKKNYLIAGVVGILVLSTWLSWSYYRRYQLQQRARLQAAILHQQELATHAVIEAEERERRRIAGDLHDGVGQLMSAAKMNLSMVGSELQLRDPDQQAAFDKAMALVDESCREVRTVSHQIMPNALLKSGLSTAIREFISKIDQRVIKVNLYTEGLNARLDGNVEPVLYRIVQECVNNVIKHAGATQLDISIIRDDDGISLTVEDNGKGFDTSDPARFEGIGIKNIQSRADYLGGQAEWHSAPGKGTAVMIHVPVA